MTRSKKYFLSFVGYALIMLIAVLSELQFVDHPTPFKLMLPVIFILPAYAVLIHRIRVSRTMDNN